jgi:excisionase family DNA binding protein
MLLTVEQAAERMGVGVRFIRRLIDERRIRFVRLGERKTRIEDTAVDEFIAAGRVEPDISCRPHNARRATASRPSERLAGAGQ